LSLFKILKGDSSRIDTSITPFHDGYAYFTPDDGGFYIDSEDDGVQRRIRINPPNSGSSTAITATLRASGWSDGRQTLIIDGITEESNGVVGVTQDITNAEMEAAKSAELYVCEQGAGTLTIAAFSETPTCDIPVMLILFD